MSFPPWSFQYMLVWEFCKFIREGLHLPNNVCMFSMPKTRAFWEGQSGKK